MKLSKMVRLSDVSKGQKCVVCQFNVETVADKRLVDMGFVKGVQLFVVGKSFANDTFAIQIRNSVLCIRKKQAEKIWVNI